MLKHMPTNCKQLICASEPCVPRKHAHMCKDVLHVYTCMKILRVSPRQCTRDVRRGNKIGLAFANGLKMGRSKEKHLPHKHKNLSSNPQNPHANPDMIVHDYTSVT